MVQDEFGDVGEEEICNSIDNYPKNPKGIEDLLVIIKDKFSKEDLAYDYLSVIDLAITKLGEEPLNDSGDKEIYKSPSLAFSQIQVQEMTVSAIRVQKLFKNKIDWYKYVESRY